MAFVKIPVVGPDGTTTEITVWKSVFAAEQIEEANGKILNGEVDAAADRAEASAQSAQASASTATAQAGYAMSAAQAVKESLDNLPAGAVPVINDLTTGGAAVALSAGMGKWLNEKKANYYSLSASDGATPEEITAVIVAAAMDQYSTGTVNSSGLWSYSGANYGGGAYGAYLLYGPGTNYIVWLQGGVYKAHSIATATDLANKANVGMISGYGASGVNFDFNVPLPVGIYKMAGNFSAAQNRPPNLYGDATLIQSEYSQIVMWQNDMMWFRSANWDRTVWNDWRKVATTTDLYHPNQLINWYLADPINQRGQTEYSGAGYGIDCWKLSNGNTKISVSGALNISSATGTYPAFLFQILENGELLTGQTVTLSAMIGGELYRITYNVSHTMSGSVKVGSGGQLLMQYYNGVYQVTFRLDSGSIDNIKAAKLELGSMQTLAHKVGDTWVLNDPPPHPGAALRECQRYLLRLTDSIIFNGGNTVSNNIYFTIPTPETMRTKPAIGAGLAGTFTVRGVGGGVSVPVASSGLSVYDVKSNGVLVRINNPDTEKIPVNTPVAIGVDGLDLTLTAEL